MQHGRASEELASSRLPQLVATRKFSSELTNCKASIRKSSGPLSLQDVLFLESPRLLIVVFQPQERFFACRRG